MKDPCETCPESSLCDDIDKYWCQKRHDLVKLNVERNIEIEEHIEEVMARARKERGNG